MCTAGRDVCFTAMWWIVVADNNVCQHSGKDCCCLPQKAEWWIRCVSLKCFQWFLLWPVCELYFRKRNLKLHKGTHWKSFYYLYSRTSSELSMVHLWNCLTMTISDRRSSLDFSGFCKFYILFDWLNLLFRLADLNAGVIIGAASINRESSFQPPQAYGRFQRRRLSMEDDTCANKIFLENQYAEMWLL